RLRPAPQDAAPVAGRSGAVGRICRCRHPSGGAGGGAERRGVGQAGDMERHRALAKLTLSLRITGVRPDGFHLLDAEMVTIDLADELTFSAGTNDLPPDDLVSRAL